MNYWKRLPLAVAAAALVVLAPMQPAQAQQTPPVTAARVGLEEIVVTARRRDEDILDTPVAISALTSDDIFERGIRSFNDIVDASPGITINSASSGRNDRSFQTITLRAMNPTFATLVATFIDGVPVSSTTAVNNVADPARVEIIRGPQTAYFGRNTFAGAINVVNQEPGDTFGGSVSLMGGSRDNYDLSGAVEGPLFSNRLGFRLSARTYSKEGSYKNVASSGDTVGDQSTDTISLFLSAAPTENLSVKLYTMYSEDDDGPSADAYLSALEIRNNNGVTNIPALSGSSAGTVVVPSVSNCNLNGFSLGRNANEPRVSRPFFCGAVPGLPFSSPATNTTNDALLQASLANAARRIRSPSEGVDGYGLFREYWHTHLNIDYQFGESGFTLSSLTGYNDEGYSELDDFDNWDNSQITNPMNSTGANPNLRPVWDLPFLIERETFDFSQEIRLAYDNGGAFSGLLGVNYLETKVWADQISIAGEIVNGTPRAASATSAPQASETSAVFFGATYAFGEQWKLNLEGRYQRDKVFGFSGGAGVNLPANNQFGLPTGIPPLTAFLEETYDEFLPRVILQYDVNDEVMAYASWAKATNLPAFPFNTAVLSGSSLVVQTAEQLGIGLIVEPEELTSYEIGLKGLFFDGRMRAQLAAYYGDWSKQLNTLTVTIQDLPVSQGGTGNIVPVTGFANSGETQIQGIELDLAFNPAPNLEIVVAAALNDSEIQSFTSPTVSQLTGVIGNDFKGNQLPLTAKYSANLGIKYGTALGFIDDGTWFARADLSWRDKQFLDASNLTWIESRTVVNLRAGISRGPLALDVFVLNAFDDDNYVSAVTSGLFTPSAFPGNSALLLGLPDLRTYGARLSYRF